MKAQVDASQNKNHARIESTGDLAVTKSRVSYPSNRVRLTLSSEPKRGPATINGNTSVAPKRVVTFFSFFTPFFSFTRLRLSYRTPFRIPCRPLRNRVRNHRMVVPVLRSVMVRSGTLFYAVLGEKGTSNGVFWRTISVPYSAEQITARRVEDDAGKVMPTIILCL